VILKASKYNPSSFDGCLVSHGHGDHCKSAKDVIKNGIDLWATSEAFEQMKIERNHYRIHAVYPGRHFMIATHWLVHPFDTVHDAPGSVGYVISDGQDKLVFLTDTGFCKYTIPGMSMLMIEANFSEEILKHNIDSGSVHPAVGRRVRENHMSIERVVDFLAANDTSRLREIRLLHLSDGNSHADLFKKTIQKATGIPVFVEG
jgi:phosphoribosyl 1,2-cyclic phosphodiesterase